MKRLSNFELDLLFAISRVGERKIYTLEESKELAPNTCFNENEKIIASISADIFIIYLIKEFKKLKVRLFVNPRIHMFGPDPERNIDAKMASSIFGLDDRVKI